MAEAEQANTEFLQQVSHELRSPLTLLLPPLADLLTDPPEPLGPQTRAAIDAAVRGGRRLQEMVDALLDAARTSRGRAPVKESKASTWLAHHQKSRRWEGRSRH